MVFEKIPKNAAETTKCVFCQSSCFFWKFQKFKKLIIEVYFIKRFFWNFCDSWHFRSSEKFSKILSKSIVNLLTLKIDLPKKDVDTKLFLFANCSENSCFWKECPKWKVLYNKQKQHIFDFVPCFFASLSRFLRKAAKINQNTQCLHCLIAQFWEVVFSNFSSTFIAIYTIHLIVFLKKFPIILLLSLISTF